MMSQSKRELPHLRCIPSDPFSHNSAWINQIPLLLLTSNLTSHTNTDTEIIKKSSNFASELPPILLQSEMQIEHDTETNLSQLPYGRRVPGFINNSLTGRELALQYTPKATPISVCTLHNGSADLEKDSTWSVADQMLRPWHDGVKALAGWCKDFQGLAMPHGCRTLNLVGLR